MTEGSLLMHVPGRMSTNVLAKGLHRIQGSTAAGIANIAIVTMANHTYILRYPSVNRSKVTPNEILLMVMAASDTVSAVAP
jgi:hypothetical protein